MHVTKNPFRDHTRVFPFAEEVPAPSVRADLPLALLDQCPAHAATPLVDSAELAKAAGFASFHIKDERGRMGLGSFKALGAAYVIAHEAQATGSEDMSRALLGRAYVTASAGNHGMSVAAGARVFGADAVIYIADTVPESFAERLRAKGARVVREGAIYEDSMAAAAQAAADNGWTLLSDSSWSGYMDAPHRLMEGYLVMMDEVFAQIPSAPTHLFLQAGVGGLAGACAALARQHWGNGLAIVVVEPEAAPALQASIAAGRFVTADGPESAMGRLDCKEASLIALKGLARDADIFALISEETAAQAAETLTRLGLPTTPSGVAGVAAALSGDQDGLNMGSDARVLTILSEGPEA